MTEREVAIGQIKEIAQELINEDGLHFNIFRLAHPHCITTEELSLKTRIVELGHSEGYIAKKLVCKEHDVSSSWVHEDY
jgi:hypothetical protein